MLEYDRIDLSEGVDTTKNKLVSRECSLCGFWYFIEQNFKYQKYLCDGCHDMSTKSVSMKNLAIVYFDSNAYRINFAFVDLKEATYLLNNSNKDSKKGTL